MITINNDFHGTSINLRANIGDELTESQIKRARSALCPVSCCTCGGPIGERGKQDGFHAEQIDYNRVRIVAA
jgi:hypothetical protein